MSNPLGRGNPLNILGKNIENFTVIKYLGLKLSKNNRKYVHWECLCNCGTKFTTTSKQIGKGKKSCGCLSKSNRFKAISAIEVAINQRFNSYRTRAKRKNLSWELNIEQFKTMILQACAYCKTKPINNIKTKSGELITINGIDRINSLVGYETNNCVPCCHFCNHAKNKYSVNEFMEWINRIKSL